MPSAAQLALLGGTQPTVPPSPRKKLIVRRIKRRRDEGQSNPVVKPIAKGATVHSCLRGGKWVVDTEVGGISRQFEFPTNVTTQSQAETLAKKMAGIK